MTNINPLNGAGMSNYSGYSTSKTGGETGNAKEKLDGFSDCFIKSGDSVSAIKGKKAEEPWKTYTVQYGEGQIQFSAPASWKFEEKGDMNRYVCELTNPASPDQKVFFIFGVNNNHTNNPNPKGKVSEYLKNISQNSKINYSNEENSTQEEISHDIFSYNADFSYEKDKIKYTGNTQTETGAAKDLVFGGYCYTTTTSKICTSKETGWNDAKGTLTAIMDSLKPGPTLKK